MSEFLIEGGYPLSGCVRVHGAKNSVLPILAAAFLAPGTCVIHNCPDLSDVSASLAILRHLGCVTRREGDCVQVDASQPTDSVVPDGLMREMRSSVLFLGAVLGRTGCAEFTLPGGCELGPRPIDLHLSALRALGAEIEEQPGGYSCRGGLRGGHIVFPLPSVGATENAMIAAVCAQGETRIENAAREPEIVDLQNFLRAMGAEVSGAGGSVITVQGGGELHPCEYTVMGDRIEAATYLSAAAAAGGHIAVTGVEPGHLSTVTSVLAEAGCTVKTGPGGMTLARRGPLRAVRPIRTAPYPGFPTDAQAPLMAAMTAAGGTTLFVENIFESRYRHVAELERMGADIRVEGRVAVVYGGVPLRGSRVSATDLRGGAALVVAALSARGESVVTGGAHIDRGYQDLDVGLRGLGASVWRSEERL